MIYESRIHRRSFCRFLIAAAACTTRLQVRAQPKPITASSELGFEYASLLKLESMVEQAITDGSMPGCVICFGRQHSVAWLRAYGNSAIQPTTVPMSIETVFDLASLTKPIATATSIMKLVEWKQLELDATVEKYLPEFGTRGKETITIRDLLLHRSGLIADNPLSEYASGADEAWNAICRLGLVSPVKSDFRYSDVNFIVLGKLVEQISQVALNEFAKRNIFEPLGMHETGYLPSDALRERSAPTEKRDEKWIQGTVHDPRAHALGGVAGHAGLFSTALDLSVYAQTLLGRGQLFSDNGENTKVLEPATVDEMTRAYEVPGGKRCLGWDSRSSYSINRGTKLSDEAFGHGGFTGTVLWIDPKQNLFFIFLSNRLHPNGTGNVNRLAGSILDVIVDSQNR